MLETFGNVRLKALACALPGRVVKVESFADRFGAETAVRFRQVVGVECFHVANPSQRASDLAEAAARHLLDTGRLEADAIDVLLFVTQTPDAVAPATASLLQGRLGLGNHVFALDLNQGCAGFLAGILTAAHFLQSPEVRNVLLLGGDTLSRWVDPNDHTSAMLFGDAGFAAVLGKGEASWTIASACEASEAITLPHGGHFHMAGTDVFNFTVTRVPEQILRVLDATSGAPDLLLLHQANAFIVRQIARMCHFPSERTPCRIARRGNTSCASLPLLLCDLVAEGVQGRQDALLSAFGVGLTWLTARTVLDFDVCLPPLILPE